MTLHWIATPLRGSRWFHELNKNAVIAKKVVIARMRSRRSNPVNLALDRHAAARLAMTIHELNKSAVIAKKVVIARMRSRRSNPVNLALDRHAASRLAMTKVYFWRVT
ncbi:MAG: hypothetical protein MUD06_09760 [Rhodospirillales bacterium]|nr:hypothetical protein [Rhodospirillales bacterium]